MFRHHDLPALAVLPIQPAQHFAYFMIGGGKTKGIPPNKLLPDKIKIFAG
jgi:hypothetical protein